MKQEIKCGATKAKPGNQKEVACTDACRARRLAMALDIDPEREGGASAFSDETVALYTKNPGWAPSIEARFRSFAENKEQKRLQFRPMQVIQRQFCHLLAVDMGLDSESQDPEPYRSVVIRKPANFVAVPRKTIAEVIGVKPSSLSSPAPAVQQLKKVSRGLAINAFVLKNIQVGIIAQELEKELAPVLKDSQLRFDIAWHGDEDVLLKPRASSLAIDQVEAELHLLSPKLKRVVALRNLASSIEACWVGQDGRIANSGASGWSLANPRKSAPVQANSWSSGPTLASRNGFDLFSGAGGSSASTIVATQAAARREKEIERERERERLREEKKKREAAVVDSWEMEADDEDESPVVAGSGDSVAAQDSDISALATASATPSDTPSVTAPDSPTVPSTPIALTGAPTTALDDDTPIPVSTATDNDSSTL